MPDDRFPAWLIDAAIAAAVADALLTGLMAAVMPSALVRRFRAWVKRYRHGEPPASAQVAAWLTTAERAQPSIAPVIGRAFADAYAAGWLVGRDTAEVMLGHQLEPPPWGFLLGDVNAAREILHERGDHGAERLFGDGRQFMRNAVTGRIRILARALVETVDMSAEKAAVRIADDLAGRNWAQGLSQTEVTRAVSAATLDSYRRDGVPAKEWMTALDQRVCPVCRDNELAGAIGLDEAFPSGDTHPPGHPGGCRCGLIPAYRDRQ